MKIHASNDTDRFEVAPGPCIGRLKRIVDFGTQTGTWEGKQYSRRKVNIGFQLFPEDAPADQAVYLSKTFTASLDERASLRRFVEGLRGAPITAEDLVNGFELNNLLGTAATLNITQNSAGKPSISSAMPLMAGMNAPEGEEVISYNIGDDISKLPSWMVNVIAQSPEGAAAGVVPVADAALGAEDAPF